MALAVIPFAGPSGALSASMQRKLMPASKTGNSTIPDATFLGTPAVVRRFELLLFAAQPRAQTYASKELDFGQGQSHTASWKRGPKHPRLAAISAVASSPDPGEMPWKGVLPREKVALIQSSYKEVAEKVTADGFGKLFYQTLFEMAPGAKDLFKMKPEVQEKMFADTLTLLVEDIDDAEKAVPVLLALATRHTQYGVQEAHFSLVGAGLLGTLRLVLGPAFTNAVEEAWTNLWKITTDVMSTQIQAVRAGEAQS